MDENLKVVCFDLWQTLATNNSKLFPKIAKIMDTSTEEVVSIVTQSRIFTADEDIEILIKETFDPKLDSSEVNEIIRLWKQAPNHSSLVDYRMKLVEFWKTRSRVVLLSNIDRYGFKHFQDKQYLKDTFDRLYLSYRIGLTKPNPRLFRKVREDCETQFSKMLFYGDSIKHDKKPANELGINFIHLPKV